MQALELAPVLGDGALGQVTIFSGVERRRRWSAEQKQALVLSACAPGAIIAEVARAADVHASQLYRWRRELGARREAPSSGFAEVVVAPAVGEAGFESVIEVTLGGARVGIAKTAPATLVTATFAALAR